MVKKTNMVYKQGVNKPCIPTAMFKFEIKLLISVITGIINSLLQSQKINYTYREKCNIQKSLTIPFLKQIEQL